MRLLKIVGIVVLCFLLLCAGLTLSLRFPSVQNFAAQKATQFLSYQLGTKVSIEKFEWNLFRNIDLKGFYMADKNGDTLIAAKTLNVDVSYWSIFKKSATIKSIRLEDAKVHLKQDVNGNLNLSELFKSKAASTKPSQSSSPFDGTFDLDVVQLLNTDFQFRDDKNNSTLKVGIPTFQVSLDAIDLKKKLIAINELNVSGIKVDMTIAPIPDAKDTSEAIHFLKGGWQIKWNKINLEKSEFAFTNENKEPIDKGIDFGGMLFSNINFKSGKGAVIADTVFAQIEDLNLKEKSGFEVTKLATNLRFAVSEITCADLNLTTPNSHISNYFSLGFHDFKDFKDFMNTVYIHAKLDKTKFSLKDLNYFIPKLDKVAHNTFLVSGEVNGRINNLKGKNLEVHTGNRSVLKGDFYTRGLPVLNETSINLRIDKLLTSVQDIRTIYPTAKYPEHFNELGNISFYGNFDGFISDFVTQGNLTTSIGSANSDINFKYNKETAKSAYSGNLALQSFDLGKWFGDTANLGKVSLATKINGTGITLDKLNARLSGQVSQITLRGYDYKDLKVDGNVKSKSFTGSCSIKDDNLDIDFNGLADISKDIPEFIFKANVRKADLRALHLLNDSFTLVGKLDADFKGKKLDEMLGKLYLDDVRLTRGRDTAYIQSSSFKASQLLGGDKVLSFESDEIQAEIKGKFSLTALPKSVKRYIDYTFTKNYVDTDKYTVPQIFSFDVKVFDSSGLTKIIDPKFKLIRNSVIHGNANSTNREFNITASIPELQYDNYTVKRFDLNGTSQQGKINVLSTIDKVLSSDSLIMDTLVAHVKNEGDDYRFDLKVADKIFYNRADVTAYLSPQKGSANIRFLPSEVWLGGNKWQFSPDNNINFAGKIVHINNLVFSSGTQSIKTETYFKTDTSTSIRLTLNETSLADFVGIFKNTKTRDFKATINGTAEIEDVFYKPNVLADFTARDITIGKELIGNLIVKSTLDDVNKRINLTGTLNSDKNNVAINGFYSIAKDKPDLHVELDLQSINLNFLNYPFFLKYVKLVRGTAQGKLLISGTPKAPNLTGKLHINDANVTVSFLNTAYSLINEDIEVGDGYFDLGNLTLFDRFNNKVTGNGRIYHDHLKKFTLDLHVNTENAEFLNTTSKELPTFFGNIMGKGRVDFTGTIPIVNIRAFAKINDGTHCYIPINSTYETNKYGFYKFVNNTKDSLTKVAKKDDVKISGVNFILDLDVTPDGIVDILLDQSAGDVLSSRGRGNLKIEILRTGEFNIYGLYEIDRGNYMFTLQNIINKKFTLDKGGTIRFNGDVYRAQLNADAVYEVRSSTYDLIDDLLLTQSSTGSTEATARAKNRINVKLLLKLAGVLQSPDISFDIKPQDPDPLIRTLVESKMSIVKSNETEMNKQVFGLLVMNRFLPTASSSSNALSNPTYIGGSATNTVSEFLTSQLSMYMNNFFDNLNVKDFDVNLNFRQYDQLSSVSSTANQQALLDTRRELQLALSKRFFNNRLTINVGGNLDFGDRTNQDNGTVVNNKNANLTGDFQIEYALDKAATWRAKAFNRGDYDNFNQRNRNRTGLALSYRQDFDNFIDLFKRRAKKPKPENLPSGKKEENPTEPKGN